MNRLRSATVWAIRYGLPGAAIRFGARRGDLIARLTADQSVRADPFRAYDELRSRGPLPSNRFVSATASHRVASDALRGNGFFANPGGGVNAALDRVLAAAVDPQAIGPVDQPSLLTIRPRSTPACAGSSRTPSPRGRSPRSANASARWPRICSTGSRTGSRSISWSATRDRFRSW